MSLQENHLSSIWNILRGCVEYFIKPELKTSWGGPFNGQNFRKKIFFDLLDNLSLGTIVETGTYRGTTTALFLSTSLPVYSTESALRYYSYCLTRFFTKRQRLHLFRKDSRDFLHFLAADPSFPKQNIFFYLDAHWENDLPLREEVDIIVSYWRQSVIMIDDFCIPGTDYEYDNYGEGKVLNIDYLYPVIVKNHIPIFFPAVGADGETGAKRGVVVLATDADMSRKLELITTLKKFSNEM